MTTFVTAFFNVLPQDHPDLEQRYEDYKEKSTDLLKNDMQLLFFGDERMALHVWQQRKAFGFADKTYCVPMAFDKLPLYERQQIIQDIYAHGDSESSFTRCARFTPRYQIVILSKLFLLEQASTQNPFGSEYFVWMDYGYYRHRRGLPHSYNALPHDIFAQIAASWSGDTLRIAALCYPYELFRDIKAYNKVYRQAVAANVFGGSKAAIKAILPRYEEELQLLFAHNILACEENVFGRLLMLYPSLFDVFIAQYTTVLNNFPNQVMSFGNSVRMIGKFCFFGNNHAELSNCLRLLDAVTSGRLEKGDMIRLYDYICISAYYTDRGLYRKYKAEALAYFDAHALTPSASVLRNMSY
jgi:hypothetical protein